MKSKIIRNAAKCRLCGDIIETKKLYENPTCSCGEISISGGLHYIERCASNRWSNIIDLSEYEEYLFEA